MLSPHRLLAPVKVSSLILSFALRQRVKNGRIAVISEFLYRVRLFPLLFGIILLYLQEILFGQPVGRLMGRPRVLSGSLWAGICLGEVFLVSFFISYKNNCNIFIDIWVR